MLLTKQAAYLRGRRTARAVIANRVLIGRRLEGGWNTGEDIIARLDHDADVDDEW